MNNPIWPDAQPWENYLFAIIALIIVVVNRKAMLSREGAVTEVLMPGEEVGSPTMSASPPTTDPPTTHTESG